MCLHYRGKDDIYFGIKLQLIFYLSLCEDDIHVIDQDKLMNSLNMQIQEIAIIKYDCSVYVRGLDVSLCCITLMSASSLLMIQLVWTVYANPCYVYTLAYIIMSTFTFNEVFLDVLHI